MKFFRRKYIGTVSGVSHIIGRDGEEKYTRKGRWVLTLGPFGGRRATLHGDPGRSGFSNDIRAKIAAWKAGGPLPELDQDSIEKPPAPVLRLVK